MNFVFVSPQFPSSYWRFCAALRRRGVRVLGIGDTPYDLLDQRLRDALEEYYLVSSLEDYDQVFRAVAFFSFKYGKVDWIESNNEHWLALDARLRDDFNVRTGPGVEQISAWRSKAAMKGLYAASGVPSARQIPLTNYDDTRWFIGEMGHFPVFAKPEVGVGSGGARILTNEDELRALIAEHGNVPYVVEELVTGQICSYDAILDSHGEPIFENQEEFPPSMERVAREGLDLSYYSCPDVDPRLRELGRAAARGFGITSRFVHMEFFRLDRDRMGLGAAGDYVGLEVNVRPPGGSTPDMICVAHDEDVYEIWADMVCYDERMVEGGDAPAYCAYASRRDAHAYARSHDEVVGLLGEALVSCGPVPEALSDELGDFGYTARLATREEVDEFVRIVQGPAPEPPATDPAAGEEQDATGAADGAPCGTGE